MRRLFCVIMCLGLMGCLAAYENTELVIEDGQVVEEVVYAPIPPPVPLVEVVVVERSGYVWCHGYWHWGGERYHWIPGHYVPQVPGRVWVQPHYYYRGGTGTYVHVQGHWHMGGHGHR